MKAYLLFDFDGTIADSLGLGVEIFNNLAPKYHLKPFTAEDLRILRSLPTHKALKHMRIPLYKLPLLIPVFMHEYRHIISHLKAFEGMKECLLSLKESGYGLALLSSNSQENVRYFLDQHEMNYFEWVEGGSGLFKKQVTIEKQIKKHGLDRQSLIYVGDETRDIVAAHKCRIKIISVTWGFQTEEILKTYNPDFIVRSAADITEIVNKL